MTSMEKAELMKSTIYQLYTNEGRSISYISRLLEINRRTISHKIKEWEFPEAKFRHHMTPSTQKFLNKNKSLIKARLDADIPVAKIAEELGVSRHMLQKTIIMQDDVLKKAKEDYLNRREARISEKKNVLMDQSYLEYDDSSLDGEIWQPILGYDNYMISNAGRVRRFCARYHHFYLIQPCPNKNNGRLYVALYRDNKKRNMQVANLVAHAFVNGYSKEKNTVNHKDGDVTNNWDWNLEWMSQAENNLHAYRSLHKKPYEKRRYVFSKLIYQGKYEFKTVAAFARFLGKSETQVRRYLDEPARHQIEFVK